MRPQSPIWHFCPPSTALRGPTWSSTEAPTGTACMRPPQGAPPKPPVGPPACVPHTHLAFSPAQYNASWPHREPHRP
eukprot:1380346-Pyramimonas_sp.AAC.1